ncbi:MAG: cytochrome c [Kofleriaceae bacterium]
MKKLIAISLFAAACGTGDSPNTDPLPTWGVPISGGTMITSADGTRAIIADPDRDRVMITDLLASTTTEIALTANDEPGRLVEDAAGRIHVALRRGAAIATIQDGALIARRAVCAEPRGITYDAANDNILVACATGELVTLPASGGQATRSVFVDRDLRDVVVVNGTTFVSRFRTAQLLELDATGAIVRRTAIPDAQRFDNTGGFDDGQGTIAAKAAVAWKTIGLADGSIAIVHQRGVGRMLSTQQGGYGGMGCGGTPIESTITIVKPVAGAEPTITTYAPINGSLPVDLAIQNGQLAIALAGNQTVVQSLVGSLVPDGNQGCPELFGESDNFGSPTSVAFADANTLVTFYPELPGLVIDRNGSKNVVQLPGDIGYDAGRNLFHREANAGIACASCHPEGRDDGLVWNFEELGPRRTQVLAGDLLKRAPYHWTGDEANLPTLMDDVFAVRMGGGQPTNNEHRSLGPWLQRVPAPAPITVDADAAARGKAIFEDQGTLCTTCHTGELMTTKQVVDVGTGGKFKVPSLVGVGARAPFIHDGCAATLTDRFSAQCGGADAHGKTSQLTAAQVSDLVAYLETL